MNWQEKLQALDKSETKEERAICESEIVLDFMQTEVFTRLVKLRDEIIEMGLTVTLIPNCADDIKLPDYADADDIGLPDTLVEISVNKNGETVIHTAKFKRCKTSLTIELEVPKNQSNELKVMTTISILSPNLVLLIEDDLKGFKDIFLKK